MTSEFKDIPDIFKNADLDYELEIDDFEKQADKIIRELTNIYIETTYESILNLQQTLDYVPQLSKKERNQLIKDLFFKTVRDIKLQGSTFGYSKIAREAETICQIILNCDDFSKSQLDDFRFHIANMEKALKEKPNIQNH